MNSFFYQNIQSPRSLSPLFSQNIYCTRCCSDAPLPIRCTICFMCQIVYCCPPATGLQPLARVFVPAYLWPASFWGHHRVSSQRGSSIQFFSKTIPLLPSLQSVVWHLIVTDHGAFVLQTCFSFGLRNLMVSRHAARQSNVAWGGIKLCFGGNSQWQVTTVSHKVSSPHRDSLGCGAEREQPCKATSAQSKWHINTLVPCF